MKIVAGADWRDAIPFETPIVVADLAPGDDARCAACPAEAPALARTELWAVKHRHPKNHSGFVRFYCAEHRPAPPVAPVTELPARRASAPKPRARREPVSTVAPRRPAPSDTVRAMCPDCYVEVSATGECGMCGRQVV